jgi:alkaline phosphatase D
MHQNYPLIAVWDDHESANDSWRDGAENHTEGAEGTWVDRKAASIQAYYEWMPLRMPDENNTNRIFRQLSYGDLADIWMLDTRLYDRDEQSVPNQFNNPDRTMIGPEQMTWLQEGMAASNAQYQILGQQVVMAPWVIPNYQAETYTVINADQWDGYNAERTRLYDFILEADIDNVVVLTGDVHTGWAQDLPYDIFEYNANSGASSVGVEFVSNAVTSSSLDFPFPIGELLIPVLLPWVKYVELTLKGYVILDLNANRVQGDFYTVGNIEAPTSGQTFQEGWFAPDGVPNLQKATSRSTSNSVQPPLMPLEPRDLTITSTFDQIQFDILGIYPNPFMDDLLLEVHLFEQNQVSIQIIDAKGAVVMSKDYGNLAAGRNLITLHEMNLPSGMYGVLLRVGEQKILRQVVRN